MTEYKPKLIEVALPLAAINAAGYREQTIKRGKPTQMHKWWAGRPMATARAVIWASLVDDPSGDPSLSGEEQEAERQRLFGILERLVLWENTNNADVLAEARAEVSRCYPDGPPPVLDPFGGGGAIPLEAQRLGLHAITGDLNPVAVMLQKAMLEVPPRFAGRAPVNPSVRVDLIPWNGTDGLAADVEAYGNWMREEAIERLGHLFADVVSPQGEKVTPIAWVWARTVMSPDPAWARHVPLVTTWWLTKKGKTWIEPVVDRTEGTIRYCVRTDGSPSVSPTIDKGVGTCVATGSTISAQHIKTEAQAGRLGTTLIAVVAKSDSARGRIFLEPDPIDALNDVAEHARQLEELAGSVAYLNVPLPKEALGFRVQRYGFDQWSKLFSARQLLGLETFSILLAEVLHQCEADAIKRGLPRDQVSLRDGGSGARAYSEAVVTYLAFAINRLADWNNTLCGWDSTNSVNQQLFRRQTVSMIWDHCEIRPFDNAAGSFGASVGTIANAIRALPAGDIVVGRSSQIDCRTHLRNVTGAVVSTDPPYYDNIGYADLSDFFYVWMRRNLSAIWPDELATLVTPKADELIADPGRHGGRSGAEAHFESGMAEFMNALSSSQSSSAPATVYYAYKAVETKGGEIRSTGWDTFLQAVIDAGLVVTATWPIRTENPSRLRAIGANALSTSIVLACRPRGSAAELATGADFLSALREELPEAVRTLQSGNVAPVDIPQSTIGPGIGIFSRYAKVVESDGSAMRVSTALGLINEVLGEVLDGEESEMDPDSRFALTWYSQFGYNPAPAGDADSMARAKNTSMNGVVTAGIGEARGGKFRLFERAEMDSQWSPGTDDRLTVWEATQHLTAALERSESEAASLLAQLGGYGERARTLAYLLFGKATDRGWAGEASAYNNLVQAWSALRIGSSRVTVADAQQRIDFE